MSRRPRGSWPWVLAAAVSFAGGGLLAKAPRPVEELLPVNDLALEVRSQIEFLQKALVTEEEFEKQKDKGIRQSFGLLACLGQALAEHPDQARAGINGAALRDAALRHRQKGNYADAQWAWMEAKDVVAGEVVGEHAPEHPWNKLVNMHPMMEEINSQNGALLKVLRRPRGTPTEVLPARVWIVLGLAMKADTHEVKNPEDIPLWNQYSDEFIDASAELANAILAKDGTTGRAAFDKANAACDACHEKFRD